MSTNAVRLERHALDVREEPIMHEGGYLPYRPGNKFWEAFVVAQLVEEVVTINDDELSSLETENGSENPAIRATFARHTKKVQAVDFAILFGQEEHGARGRCPVNRGDVPNERDPPRLRDRMRHGCGDLLEGGLDWGRMRWLEKGSSDQPGRPLLRVCTRGRRNNSPAHSAN